MEHINQFSKGINKDASDIFQPKDTAKNLKHWVQISEDGDTYSISNENGVTDTLCNIPSGFKIIGYTVLNTEILVVLAHTSGYSQIGYIDYDNVYHRVVPSTDTGSQLGFTIDHPVDCVAKKTYSGDRILYYTDNNVPFGSINLDNPPDDSEIESTSKLINDVKEPIIVPYKFKESSGQLYCGAYQFSIRYVNEDLSTSTVLGTTNIVPVVDEFTTSSFKDGNSEDTLISKSILLKLYNLDTTNDKFQLIAHRYNSSGTVLESYALQYSYITDSEMEYEFNGILTDAEKLDLAEIRETLISYDKAKCIEQIDNRLILANLSESTNIYNEELQNIANNIVVKYKVHEEAINNKLDSNSIELFSVYDEVFAISNNEISYVFTDFVKNTTTEDDYKLYPWDTTIASTGTVQVTAIIGIIGQTLTIDDTTFTFVASGETETNIVITTSTVNDIAQEIYTHLSTYFIDKFSYTILTDTISIYYKYPGDDTFVLSTTSASITTSSDISGGTSIATTEIDATSISSITDNVVNVIYNVDLTTYTTYFTKVTDIINLLEDSSFTSTTYEQVIDSVIVYTPIIPEVSNNSASGYSNELNTTFKKGFKRGEVYSLGLKVKFTDSSDSYVFHIPGSNVITTSTVAATPDSPGTIIGDTTGTLGTYISSIDYPSNSGLPGDRLGDDNIVNGNTVVGHTIRHHVMPTLDQEPSFRYDSTASLTYIRILGIECEFNIPFSSSLADKIQTLSIVRESRNKSGSKSILAQGFGFPMLETYYAYDRVGDPIPSSKVLMKQPYFGGLRTEFWNDIGVFKIDSHKYDEIQFYSPELTLNTRLADDNLDGAKIKTVLGVQSDDINNIFDKSIFNKTKYYNTYALSSENFIMGSWWQSMYYNNIISKLAVPSGYNDSTTIQKALTINNNELKSTSSFSNPLYNINGISYVALSLNDSLQLGSNTITNLYFEGVGGGSNPVNDSYTNNVWNDGITYTTNLNKEVTLNILEIYNELSSQYGELDLSEYIECISTTNVPTSIDTLEDIFGGDIFITPFSVTNKSVLPIHMNPNFLSIDFKVPGSIDNTYEDREPILGFNAKCLYNVILESEVNCDFRHEFEDDTTIQTRYYPKSSAYDTLKVAIEKDECISYNTQYSLENAVKTYFVNLSGSSISGDFSNRLIYSSNLGLDSIIDNYKQFPINNYQDIPKHTGEIWDLFVLNDTIYAHTPKSMWRLFNKDNTSIKTSDISEVVLGTGDAFNINAREQTSFKGGYAGSISQFAGTHTPAGYIFPDVLQGKVFLFNGQGLQELSRSGLLREFNNNLSTGLINVSGYMDNPYTGNGILGTYDFDLKRYLISKKGYTTYSYSFINNCWFSQHDYIPDLYVSINNKLYMIDNTNQKFYEANTGNKGDFKTLLPSVVSSDIEFIVNPSADYTKVFDNMIFNTNSYDSNGVYLPYDTFNTLSISNDLQSINNLNIEVNNEYSFPDYSKIIAKFKNNEYRISLPRSNNDDRIKSKYAKINLKYNNTSNNHFIVNFIKTLFRINKR